MRKTYLNVTDRRTDRQTDGITALCVASRGKNYTRSQTVVEIADRSFHLFRHLCCTSTTYGIYRPLPGIYSHGQHAKHGDCGRENVVVGSFEGIV